MNFSGSYSEAKINGRIFDKKLRTIGKIKMDKDIVRMQVYHLTWAGLAGFNIALLGSVFWSRFSSCFWVDQPCQQ